MGRIIIKGDKNQFKFGLFTKRGRTKRKLLMRNFEPEEIKNDIRKWFEINEFSFSMTNNTFIASKQIRKPLLPFYFLSGKIFLEIIINKESRVLEIQLYHQSIGGHECSIESLAYIDEVNQSDFFGMPGALTIHFRSQIRLAEDFLTFLDSKGEWLNE